MEKTPVKKWLNFTGVATIWRKRSDLVTWRNFLWSRKPMATENATAKVVPQKMRGGGKLRMGQSLLCEKCHCLIREHLCASSLFAVAWSVSSPAPRPHILMWVVTSSQILHGKDSLTRLWLEASVVVRLRYNLAFVAVAVDSASWGSHVCFGLFIALRVQLLPYSVVHGYHLFLRLLYHKILRFPFLVKLLGNYIYL